jgi:hypothetical protein
MATTKYIVNKLSGQTIDGNLTINGSITVTGTSNNSGVYRALLTQTGSITGTYLPAFNYGLIVGETYTITDYVNGDDFSNIADVQSGGTLIFDYVGAAIGYGGVNGVTGTTSGLGSGATFNVYWCGTTYNSVIVVSSGVDYVVGDTITILGEDVSGSTPTNNITITITDFQYCTPKLELIHTNCPHSSSRQRRDSQQIITHLGHCSVVSTLQAI